jgi:2-dehydropantoate 2-reductase
MRILIYGTGAVGGYFGARLAEAGNSVCFLARGANLQSIRKGGLRIESPKGNYRVWPIDVRENIAGLGPVDAVILGVKAWQVPEAAQAVRPLIGRGTKVLTLQNGVEAPFQVAEQVGEHHVLGCVCRIIASQVAPGHIRHLGMEPTLILGELGTAGVSETAVVIGEILRSAGIAVELTTQLEEALWQKLLFIAAMSGVGAVTRASIGEIREIEETRSMLRLAMEEIFDVAYARGIALHPAVVDRTLSFIDSIARDGTTSMQRDIAEGRPSELDAIVGAVLRTATQFQVKVPINNFIHAALLPQERRVRPPSTYELPTGR